jgi:hypothetical protein
MSRAHILQVIVHGGDLGGDRWLGTALNVFDFRFYLTIHIQMQDSKSKDRNKPNLFATRSS